MRTTVILVRHGHVEGIDQPRFRGRVDLPLTATGLRQAEETGEYVRSLIHPDVIYSSPLSRCIDTASGIGGPLGLTPVLEQGLIDLDYGAWQGRLISEVSEESGAEVSAWFNSPAQAKIPNGENLPSLAKRVRETLERILKDHAGGAIAIVGHDNVNRVILLQAFGLPLERYWRLGQGPGAVNRLEYANGDWSVLSMNETAHFTPTPGAESRGA